MSAKSSSSKSTTTNPYAIQAFQTAQAALPSGYSPVTGAQIQGFMDPFRPSVIDATTARNNQNQALALDANHDAAIRAGAFGGTGSDVADALTRGQYDLNNQQTTAGLNAANYSQALAVAAQQNAATNQYPLLLQQLLGQLAQGTQQTTKGSATQFGVDITASIDPTKSGNSLSWLNLGG